MDEKLGKLKPLFDIPIECSLKQGDWLELIASYHFLRTASKLDAAAAEKRLAEEKPHLKDFVDLAHKKLIDAALLN